MPVENSVLLTNKQRVMLWQNSVNSPADGMKRRADN